MITPRVAEDKSQKVEDITAADLSTPTLLFCACALLFLAVPIGLHALPCAAKVLYCQEGSCLVFVMKTFFQQKRQSTDRIEHKFKRWFNSVIC